MKELCGLGNMGVCPINAIIGNSFNPVSWLGRAFCTLGCIFCAAFLLAQDTRKRWREEGMCTFGGVLELYIHKTSESSITDDRDCSQPSYMTAGIAIV